MKKTVFDTQASQPQDHTNTCTKTQNNSEKIEKLQWITLAEIEQMRQKQQLAITFPEELNDVLPFLATRTHKGIYGIIRRAGQLLLIRKRRGPYTGRFDLPGGSPEPGESETQTLAREIAEETGCQLLNSSHRREKCIFFTEFYENDGRPGCLQHTAIFFDCTVNGTPDTTIDDLDSGGACWVDLPCLTSENTSPLVKFALEQEI